MHEKQGKTFGKVLRELRSQRNETLYQLGQALGVTPALISAIEIGAKNKKVSSELLDKMLLHFGLKGQEAHRFAALAAQTGHELRIPLTGADPGTREVAMMFARTFKELDEERLDKLKQLLRDAG